MKKILVTLAALTASLSTNAQNIKFTSHELYPEGTAYNKKDKSFYVTSLRYGKVGKVAADGKYSVFVDDKDIISAIGTLIDEKTNTLYVAISDPGVSVKTNPNTQYKLAKVAAYDLTTGKRKYLADLGALNADGNNFANDLTLDDQGNVYVTNSFAPIIYKIDSKGLPTIFARHTDWEGAGFNLNGIRYHKDGFLLVAQMDKGLLYKVDVKHPDKISVVKADSIKGADGLVLNEKGDGLVVISNSQKKIFKLSSSDNWKSAKVEKSVESVDTYPTTGVLVDGKYYVLNAKLNELFMQSPAVQLSEDFLIQEVKF
ncbi:MAG TPA: hypothetical protein VL947_01695 [Cytophagales bacterium]|nr:hypothetical protein [Cytophagales bacterium]